MSEWNDKLQEQAAKWLDENDDEISEALMDAMVFGEGKVRRTWDGDLEHVPHPGRKGCQCGQSAQQEGEHGDKS